VLLDNHLVPIASPLRVAFVSRLDASGHLVATTVIPGDHDEDLRDVATDASGGSYANVTCAGQVLVQPEVTCTANAARVIAAYDPDRIPLWTTPIVSARADSIAPAPDKRLIVAGTADTTTPSFGGVPLTFDRTGELFIAALATGPRRPPPPPSSSFFVTGAHVDGQVVSEVRQGGTSTLTIEGSGLEQVMSVRVGDIDVHVPPVPGTNVRLLTLPLTIPHGHAFCSLELTVRTATGSTDVGPVALVQQIIVAPDGTRTGLGVFRAPLDLCRADWSQLADFGDQVELLPGTYACDLTLSFPRGIMVHGVAQDQVIVNGTIANGTEPVFSAGAAGFGTLILDSLTIQQARTGAIAVA
jgi:hypothetical protein